jgi:hypothetical protein
VELELEPAEALAGLSDEEFEIRLSALRAINDAWIRIPAEHFEPASND